MPAERKFQWLTLTGAHLRQGATLVNTDHIVDVRPDPAGGSLVTLIDRAITVEEDMDEIAQIVGQRVPRGRARG